jgi:hypothetical protein
MLLWVHHRSAAKLNFGLLPHRQISISVITPARIEVRHDSSGRTIRCHRSAAVGPQVQRTVVIRELSGAGGKIRVQTITHSQKHSLEMPLRTVQTISEDT